MFDLYYIPKTINDLKSKAYMETLSMKRLKKDIQILVIDDKEFTYLDSLRERDFYIKGKQDITDLNDVVAYDIILCDIRGVGKFLGSEFEGANLIKVLKTQFPSKYYVAYSAEQYSAKFETYLDYADKKVEKGSLDLEDWVNLLENAIKELVDPVSLWKKKRTALLLADVTTIDVAKYESKYVKAIMENSYTSFDKLCDTKDVNGVELLKDLASSAIAKLLKN